MGVSVKMSSGDESLPHCLRRRMRGTQEINRGVQPISIKCCICLSEGLAFAQHRVGPKLAVKRKKKKKKKKAKSESAPARGPPL